MYELKFTCRNTQLNFRNYNYIVKSGANISDIFINIKYQDT